MGVKQFDVFTNPDPASAKSHPYLVVLQSDVLDRLNTRIVAPLIPPTSLPFFERLMPVVSVEGASYVIDPTNMGAVHVRMLKNPVASLSGYRERILAAIDLVIVGI
nr:CcdB family protein [Rhizomicrobium palustre]